MFDTVGNSLNREGHPSRFSRSVRFGNFGPQNFTRSDRIGSDPSLKKCDRIGSVRKPDLKSQDRIGSVLGRDRFGPARIFTILEYILKIELINSALT